MVQIRVTDVQVRNPRQWGACWLALSVWDRLELDRFWGPRLPRLPPSRQGTRWLDVLKVQVCYRLIDPGSDWRLHRHWYHHSALRDLLGTDRVLASNTLYRCLDKLVVHKRAFFSFLRARWTTLFDARFDVLLYDLTSTYFESDPPFDDKRRFGYSRDKRSDCVQVVIALIVTPDGFPLAYEVMPGNTTDPCLHVSHETIYLSLFVQSRGVLKKALNAHLRRRRRMRRSKHASTAGQCRGQIIDAVSIQERPAEAADRAVPGHWEGDLLGSSGFWVGDFGARSEPRASNVAYPAPRAASTETQVEPRRCRAGAMETRKCRTNRDIPTFPQP